MDAQKDFAGFVAKENPQKFKRNDLPVGGACELVPCVPCACIPVCLRNSFLQNRPTSRFFLYGETCLSAL